MKVIFSINCGEGGDLQALLTARSQTGMEVSEFIPRTGWFRYWKIRRAKKRLLKQLEIMTGRKHYESYI